MVDGKIAEKGSYSELMAADGALAALVKEHVSNAHSVEEEQEIVANEEQDLKLEHIQDETIAHEEKIVKEVKKASTKSEGALMMKEEREVGAVSGKVYARYIRAMGSMYKVPVFLLCLALAQTSNVGTTVLLGKWSEQSIPGWDRSKCESNTLLFLT